MSEKKDTLISIISLMIAVGILWGAYWWLTQDRQENPNPNPIPIPSPSPTPSASSQLEQELSKLKIENDRLQQESSNSELKNKRLQQENNTLRQSPTQTLPTPGSEHIGPGAGPI